MRNKTKPQHFKAIYKYTPQQGKQHFWITDQQFSMPKGNLIIITDLLTKAHTQLLNLIDRALQRCKLWEGIRQSSRNGGTQGTKIKPGRCWELSRRLWEKKCEKHFCRVGSWQLTNPVVAQTLQSLSFSLPFPSHPEPWFRSVEKSSAWVW